MIEFLLHLLASTQTAVLNAWMWIFTHKALALIVVTLAFFYIWVNLDDMTDSNDI